MRNKRHISKFHIFYRISDNGNIGKDKLPNATKINCLRNAINVFCKYNIIFHLFIDKVIDDTDKKIHEICDEIENIHIEYLTCAGNSKSFLHILDLACQLADDDFVYFIEDDYIHLKQSYNVLKDAAEWNYTDYFTLYDHLDKYDNSECPINMYCTYFGENTVVFKTSNHHWKITNSTTMTFGAFVDSIKRDKAIFAKNCYDKCPDDFSIFIELNRNGILLSSPIPSLSTHIEIKYLAPFINWENEIKKLD